MISTTSTTRIDKIQAEKTSNTWTPRIKQPYGPVPLSSSSRPMPSADHERALVQIQEDGSTVHPEEGLILSSDRVSAACNAGGISQTRQIVSFLTGTAQKNGQTLVSWWTAHRWRTRKLVLPVLLTT